MRNVRMLKDILADCITDLCNGEGRFKELIHSSNKPELGKGRKLIKEHKHRILKGEVHYE